jgi:hypothetical protein
VDPTRKAAAEGAAKAQKQKNASASEVPRKGPKVKTPKSTRPSSADKNETKP